VSFYGIDTLSDEQRGLKHYNATKVTIMTRNRSSTPGKQKHKQKKLMLNLLLSITLLTYYYQIAVAVMGLCTATNMLQKQN